MYSVLVKILLSAELPTHAATNKIHCFQCRDGSFETRHSTPAQFRRGLCRLRRTLPQAGSSSGKISRATSSAPKCPFSRRAVGIAGPPSAASATHACAGQIPLRKITATTRSPKATVPPGLRPCRLSIEKAWPLPKMMVTLLGVVTPPTSWIDCARSTNRRAHWRSRRRLRRGHGSALPLRRKIERLS